MGVGEGVTVGEDVVLGGTTAGAAVLRLNGKVQLVMNNRQINPAKMRFVITGLYWYLSRVSSQFFKVGCVSLTKMPDHVKLPPVLISTLSLEGVIVCNTDAND